VIAVRADLLVDVIHVLHEGVVLGAAVALASIHTLRQKAVILAHGVAMPRHGRPNTFLNQDVSA
jgi:hypothetical protein